LLSSRPDLILLLDVRDFFGSISQVRLLETLRGFGVNDAILSTVSKAIQHPDEGLPRGNGLSPILANVYLASLDQLFTSRYVRFSDDLIFAVATKREADATIALVREHLASIGLTLNDQKTKLFRAPSEDDIIAEYPWLRGPSI